MDANTALSSERDSGFEKMDKCLSDRLRREQLTDVTVVYMMCIPKLICTYYERANLSLLNVSVWKDWSA